MTRFWCCCLLLACSCSSSAAQPLRIDPRKLLDEIKTGTVPAQTARSLGLACADRNLDSEIDYVRLKKNESYSVVQAYETMCDTRTLMIFRAVTGEWEYTQTLL